MDGPDLLANCALLRATTPRTRRCRSAPPSSEQGLVMTTRAISAIGCAVLMALGASAQAAQATFEDTALAFIGNGDSLDSGQLRFTQGGDFGGVADAATFDLFAN